MPACPRVPYVQIRIPVILRKNIINTYTIIKIENNKNKEIHTRALLSAAGVP